MRNWKSTLNALRTCCGRFIASAAVASLSGGAVTASEPLAVDWPNAISAFAIGEQQSPMVLTFEDAARCRARWTYHADAGNEGVFPEAATDAFIEELAFTSAMDEADFFLTETPVPSADRNAVREAKSLLARALAGEGVAARTYFENLGQCYVRPDVVRDPPDEDPDAVATITRQSEPSSIEPASGDFDERVNRRRLAFIELFVQRLRDGEAVAGLLKPKIFFVYLAESKCAAVTTAQLAQLPAKELDTGFSFWATYTPENPDCPAPPEIESLEDFNLRATMSHWSQIEFAVEDHDFEVFVLSDRRRSDYLAICCSSDSLRLFLAPNL